MRYKYMLLTQTYPCIKALNIIPINVKNSSWVFDELMNAKMLISSFWGSVWFPLRMLGNCSMFTYLLKMKYVIMKRTLKMEKHTPVINLALILSFYLFWNRSQTSANGIIRKRFKSMSKNIVFQMKLEVLQKCDKDKILTCCRGIPKRLRRT